MLRWIKLNYLAFTFLSFWVMVMIVCVQCEVLALWVSVEASNYMKSWSTKSEMNYRTFIGRIEDIRRCVYSE